MHEAGISESIVHAAVEACGDSKRTISTLGVEVGALSSVSTEALRFWLELALKNRGMQNTESRITAVPAQVKCECGNTYETEDMFSGCPCCGSYTREILSGMDVTLKWIEVEESDENRPEQISARKE